MYGCRQARMHFLAIMLPVDVEFIDDRCGGILVCGMKWQAAMLRAERRTLSSHPSLSSSSSPLPLTTVAEYRALA